jgi:hypothetical protein
VYNHCVDGMVPSTLVQGREREWWDWMRTVVRQVAAHDPNNQH